MIILNSLELLSQLTELEKQIQKIEKLVEKFGLEVSGDSLLKILLECQKVKFTSWQEESIRKGNLHQDRKS